MPDERLLQPGQGTPPQPVPAPLDRGGLSAYAQPFDDEESGGNNLGQYLEAIRRRKWLLALALVVGMVGAVAGWRFASVTYTANGNLWIQKEPARQAGAGDVEPIQQSGLFQANAWIELLRTYAVLEPVVVQERLYLQAPPEYHPAFQAFALADRFTPGSYRLSVAADGTHYTLSTQDGAFVERGELGDSVGRSVGFRWVPAARALPAGENVDFTVVPPRDASNDLSERLTTRIDKEGNFIGLSLSGPNPERAAAVLNAIMERHVALAAELKKGKLDDVLGILEEQLRYAQQQLEQAEQDLETFRVNTITLPSDNATPIAPGLEVTRDPVFGSFFQMKVDLEQVTRDRARLQTLLDSLRAGGPVQVEALQGIPEAAKSVELQRVLSELVDVRSKVRVLRDRYSDEYPPIQDLLTQERSIESQAVPRVLLSILTELQSQERDLQARVDSASTELAAIPPRTIEEARRQRRVTVQENIYNELRQRVETARLASASSIPDVDILDRASVPRKPSSDKRLPLAAMLFFGPIGVVVALAILMDRLDPRFRYPTQVSHEIGLDILGNIPRIESGTGKKGEENAAHVLEAFRELRMTVGFAYGSAGPVTLVVTSPGQGEGKSLISTNLAVAFAEVGRRTLLIDGDTRRGSAHRLLNRKRSPGLTDYLRERTPDDIIQTTEYPRLDFISCGTRSGTTPELLASSRMAEFLGALKKAYDVVIVDTPPLAAGGDAVLLGALTGNMAVVIRTGTTERPLALAKLEAVSRLPIRVLGAILNDVEPRGAYYRYYSSYLPGYEAREEDESEDGSGSALLTKGGSASGD